MHAFWLLLSGAILLEPPAVPPGTAPTGRRPSLQRPADSDGAGQSEQVRQVLTRLDRANRIVLGPDEVAVERARAIVLLRRMGQGKRLSQVELDRLLQATAECERAAVEALARQFRIDVYRTFRQRRGTVTGRRAALARVLASWESAGGQFDEQERLIDWLEVAIRNSLPGSVGPLPEAPVFTLPEFEAQPPSFEPLVAKEPPARIERPVASGPALPFAALARRNRRTTGLPHTPQPGAVPVDAPPERPVASASLPVRRTVPGGPLPGALPADRSISPPGRRAGSVAPVVQLSVAEQALPVILPPSSSRRPQVTFPARLAQRDAPATLPPAMEDPFANPLPAPSAPPPPADLPERVALLPSSSVSLPEVRPTAPQASASAVRVNLDELKVRIAGTNLALRALEDDVDEDLRWTAARLEPLVERLGGLIERRGDLSLFLDLLSPRERSRVGRLDSPRPAVSQLAVRIVDARTGATADHFPGTDADRRRELARLDRFSRKLAEMVVEP